MMEKVTLYKVTITKAYVASKELGTHFSLSPWGNDTDHYEGYDDGGKQYEMPKGFCIAESNSGSLDFYGPDGNHYALSTVGNHPMISNGHEDIHLEQLPVPMTKLEICELFEGKPELKDAIRRVRALNTPR